MIREVMDEGERLSKRQLAQENTIRKLRQQVTRQRTFVCVRVSVRGGSP